MKHGMNCQMVWKVVMERYHLHHMIVIAHHLKTQA